MIAPRKTFARNRRQAKKETRIWEKEERRRRTEVEDKKKKKATEYFRTLLAHREEFFRFHKNKRIGKRKIKEVWSLFFFAFPFLYIPNPFLSVSVWSSYSSSTHLFVSSLTRPDHPLLFFYDPMFEFPPCRCFSYH